jgi:hypothetical protein
MRRLIELLATTLIGVALLAAVLVVRNASTQGPAANAPSRAGQQRALVAPVNQAAPAANSRGPANPPTELPGPCLNHVTTVDRVAPSIETITKVSSDVVVGKVAHVGAAQWNTPTGDIPESPDDYDAFHVMRLVRFTVDDAIKGGPKSQVVAWVAGGTIGCHTFFSEEVPDPIRVGQRFALFLDSGAAGVGLSTAALHAKQVWAIDSKDRVVTPEDGLVSIATFTSRVKKS